MSKMGLTEGTTTICSDGIDLQHFARHSEIEVIGMADPQLPPEDPQASLEL
jgi:hypothetical protein